MARQQKVDLAKISILALADQYLAFIEAARKLRLELAADYLVMAAWLAYLKSRLLLPEATPAEGQSAEDMALALAHRLRRLEAIPQRCDAVDGPPAAQSRYFPARHAGADRHVKQPEWSATLYDLLTAYTSQRRKRALGRVRFAKRTVWSLAEARAALERMIGQTSDWAPIDQFLIAYVVEPAMAATVFASAFASALELVREGEAEIHQKQAFATLFMRKRVGVGAGEDVTGNATTPSVAGNA